MNEWLALLQLEAWPPQPDLLFWAALVSIVAGLLGELVQRALHLPRILGYAAVGMLLTLSGHGLSLQTSGASYRLVVDLALALLLFELGSRVNLSWLRANPALLLASLSEALLSGLAVFVTLRALGLEEQAALVCAAVTLAASGAVVGRVASELRAAGQVCERVLALTALNTVYAVLAVKLLGSWSEMDHRLQWPHANALLAVAQPLYALAGSLLVAALLARLVAMLMRRLDLRNENAALMLLGLVVLALCATRMLNLSTLLVPLLAGVLLRNSTARPWVWPRHFGTAGGVLVLMLFVITGSAWTVEALVGGASLAVVLLLTRLGSKALALLLWARPSGIELRQAAALALTLTPISGTSLVLFAELQASHAALATAAAPVVLAAIAIMELLGPALVQGGFKLAGEPQPPAFQPLAKASLS